MKKTLGAVQLVALVAVVLGGLAWAAIVGIPHAGSTQRKTTAPPSASAYLGGLGLQADALAAAGLSAQQAATLKTNLQDHLNENGTQLTELIDAWGSASRAADREARNVQAGQGNTETLASLQSSLSTALSSKQAALDAAFAAATDGLSENIKSALLRIHANRHQNAPVQYLVVDRTNKQWRQLRDALSQKKHRDSVNQPLDEDATTVISTANADPAVVTAAGRIESNLAAINAALE